MSSIATDKLTPILERLCRSRADEQAWQMLVRHLWPLVVAINYRILRGQRELAEDASQEVFLRIFRYVRFDDFASKSEDFQSYVRAICRNVSRRYLSRLTREPSFSQRELQDQEGKSAGLGRADAELSAIQREELAALLGGLDAEDRELVSLLRDGAPITEIAEALGITYSNAAVRIHRLRHNLGKLMKT